MHRVPVVALAVMLAAAPVAAQDPSTLTGRCLTPDSIDVRGVKRVSREAVLASAGLSAGTTLNFPAIQRAIRDLFATGDFDEVAVRCDVAEGDKAIIAIAVTERPLLARVGVEGPRRVSSRAVEDRVELLVGRPVDPAMVARAVTRIDSLYQANGY
ncbi:MAG TPA: hypothetical protein VFV33_13020, partial [Gemmatimonadaceae bacterium]|nr:hypothetical protein [Gemmatimonadaceae bacterium]